jgi:DNA-binding GntR family transcriptional regulator
VATIGEPAADLATRCYRNIREGIVRRRFLPGERLVPEELARSLGVSRTPVQDALRRLALEGLVEIHPRRGTAVTRVTTKGVAEVSDIRSMIEVHAAAAAAMRASPEDLDTLSRLLTNMDDVLAMADDRAAFEAWSPANAQFHRFLVQLCGNDRLLAMYDSLNPGLSELRVLGGWGLAPLQEFQAQHRTIAQALLDRDGTKLHSVLRQHIRQATDRVLATLTLVGGAL